MLFVETARLGQGFAKVSFEDHGDFADEAESERAVLSGEEGEPE
jgi:hypothetical protein